MSNVSHCSRCGTPIEFVVTDTGKRMPIDPVPNPAGNVVLTQAHSFVRGRVLKKDEEFDGPRYMPHFATCSQWSKPKRGLCVVEGGAG